ncbi:MAG: DUF4124 domain-containing protein [Nitrospira sp.]|nr:DUF4124 domain-containing protein [Nitrospira sp.]
MKFFTLSVITGFFLWPMIGSAELYKWADKQGQLHITDAPPSELQKKPGSSLKSNPRSAQPMKATRSPSAPEHSQSEVRPFPEQSARSSSTNAEATQSSSEGLSPNLATLTSAWQTFDDSQVIAKVPVERWKDERGLEHFVDVLPTGKGSTGVEESSGKRRLTLP